MRCEARRLVGYGMESLPRDVMGVSWEGYGY